VNVYSCCHLTIFTTQTPSSPLSNDGQAIELGVKFRSSAAGSITGVRFYKTAGNSGTHTESYIPQPVPGWRRQYYRRNCFRLQQVSFSTPVNVTANTTYIAAYHSGGGGFTGTQGYFNTAVVNSPLTGWQTEQMESMAYMHIPLPPHFLQTVL